MNRLLMLTAGMATLAMDATAASDDTVLISSSGATDGPRKRKQKMRALPLPPQENKTKSASLKRMLKKKTRI